MKPILRNGIHRIAVGGMSTAWRRLFAAVFALAWLVLWFLGLGSRSLSEPDEGRYAEVAREMFVSGDWLTPRLDGFNFFDKPALHYWATALFYSAFGVHEWTARLWVSLTALLTIIVVGWAVARFHGRHIGAAAAVVLGSTLLFFAGARINTTDMSVTAFLSVAICLFMVAQFDPQAARLRVRLCLLGWASIALAVLSKGLIGLLFPAMALCAFMLWERRVSIMSRLSIGWGLLVFMAIAAPWFVAMSLKHPDFFDYFFVKEHFSRFLTTADDRDHQPWFFAVVVLLGLFPWVGFLPISPGGWTSLVKTGRPVRFLLCWIVVVFVFFSVSKSKLPFYILPIFPALAILVAVHLSTLSMRSLTWRFVGVAVVAAVMAVAALTYHASTRHLSEQINLRPLLIWFARALGMLAVVSAVGVLALIWRQRNLAIMLLGFATLLAWQMVFLNMGPIASDLSAKPVAQLMLPVLRDDTEVFTVHAYLRGLPFYLQRLVTVVDEDPADIVPGSASRPGAFLADMGAFERRWSTARSAVGVVDPDLIAKLQADGLPFDIIGKAPTGVVIASRSLTDGAAH